MGFRIIGSMTFLGLFFLVSCSSDTLHTKQFDLGDEGLDTDSNAPVDSEGEPNLGSDWDSVSNSNLDSDLDSDSDGLVDTEPPPFWLPEGPKQLGMGHVTLSCNSADLNTYDCDEAPAPCIPDEPKITCDMLIMDENGGQVYDGLVGIERRGRSSIKYDKPNYAVEFRTVSGADNPVPCMGMGKEADWVLDGSWLDRSFMRNDLVSDIFSELGPKTHYGPDSRYVELEFNGQYQGVYRLVEKIKRDDDRVDIPTDDGSGSNFIVKHDDDGDIWVDLDLESNFWRVVYPNDKRITETQLASIKSWLNQFATGMNKGNPFDFVNMDNVIDYVLMQELSKNIDGYQYSLYLFKEAGQLANFVPWDSDLAFGQPRVDYVSNPSNESPQGWIAHHTHLIERFLADDLFKTRLLERWTQLRTGPLSDAALQTRIDEYLLVLDDTTIQRNFSTWPFSDVRFEHIYSVYQIPRVNSFDEEIKNLRSWISQRAQWIDNNLGFFD